MSGTLTKPVPVRLNKDASEDLQDLSDFTGTDKSKLIRLAIKIGLPEIRKRFGAESTSKTPTKVRR